MEIFWQLFLQGFVISILYLLVTTGFNVIYSTTSHFHISHAGVFTLAGYFLYILTNLLNIPLLLSTVLAFVFCSLAGVLIYLGLYRPILNRGGTPLVLFISSLGLLTLIDNLMFAIFSPNMLPIETPQSFIGNISILGGSLTKIQSTFIIVGIIFLALFYLFMNKSTLGRQIKAVAVNPNLSQMVGIPLKKIYVSCYAIGSALVAIPGFYIALDVGAFAGHGVEFVIISIMAVIIGGIGSFIGGWIAALFIGMFNNLTVLYIPPEWQMAIIFGLFLAIIMFRPMGIFGKQT